MANLITADSGSMSPVDLRSISFVHGRRFVAYAEIADPEAEHGGELIPSAEAVGGPDDGWELELNSTRIPPKGRRLLSCFVVVWNTRLPPGERWKLTLKLEGKTIATRNVAIREER